MTDLALPQRPPGRQALFSGGASPFDQVRRCADDAARGLAPPNRVEYEAPMPAIRIHDHDDGVRVLSLDRPPANALDESLLAALGAALDAARLDDGVRALVLNGTGAFFSGGFDLGAPRR